MVAKAKQERLVAWTLGILQRAASGHKQVRILGSLVSDSSAERSALMSMANAAQPIARESPQLTTGHLSGNCQQDPLSAAE